MKNEFHVKNKYYDDPEEMGFVTVISVRRQQQNTENLVSFPPPFWTPLALSLPQCLVFPSGLFAGFGANFVIMNEKYLLSKNDRIQYSVLFETIQTYSM